MVLPILIAIGGVVGFTALAYFLNLFGLKEKIDGFVSNISNFINVVKENWVFIVMIIVGLFLMTI